MARKPAKRKPSTSASESESVFDPPAQEPNDAEEETLGEYLHTAAEVNAGLTYNAGPRSSKLLAHKSTSSLSLITGVCY